MSKRILPVLLAIFIMIGITVLFPEQAQAASKPKYRIDVDLKNQIVTVYRLSDNAIVRQMVCSSGRNNRTPRGTFYLKTRKSTDRKSWYHICPKWYVRYATRITGPYLFHSVPYTKPNLNYLVKDQFKKLGSVASAGCVRLTWQNAKWISDNVVDGTKVRIFSNGKVNKPLKAALMAATYSNDSGLTYQQFLASSYIATEPGALGRGADEAKVLRLKRRLAGLGLLEGPVNGDYDNVTIAAVIRYQKAAAVEASGIVSASLFDQILADETHTDRLSTLENGADGPLVRSLQETLKAIGIYTGEVDGTYSDALADAVNIFSIYNGTGGTRKATPALQDAARALLDQLNERFGEEGFDIVLNAQTVRTVSTKTSTKLYRKASTRSKKLKSIGKGKKVSLISTGSKFYKVSYGGKTGYVKKSKLKSTYSTKFTLYWGITVDELGLRTLNGDTIGPAVSALQDRLRALGYYNGASNGRYSESVANAIKAFQEAASLDPTGEADTDLQHAILDRDDLTGTAVPLKPGDETPAVAAMQRTLKALQYYDGDCDGSYDDATAEAVKRFTKSNGFAETASASPTVQQAILQQYRDCEETYGSGNYTLSITEITTPMAKLKKAEKLYSRASTSGRKLKSAAKNTEVIVVSKNKTWTKVIYGGKTGYMRTSRLSFFTHYDYIAEFNPPEVGDAPVEPTPSDPDGESHDPDDAPEGESEDDAANTPRDSDPSIEDSGASGTSAGEQPETTPANDSEPPQSSAHEDVDDGSGLMIEYEPVPEEQTEVESEPGTAGATDISDDNGVTPEPDDNDSTEVGITIEEPVESEQAMDEAA